MLDLLRAADILRLLQSPRAAMAEFASQTLLANVDRSAKVYRSFIQSGAVSTGPIDRLALFAYRTSVLESEVIKPLVLFLCAPDLSPVPKPQLEKALDVLESWMVRRMLVRATTKGYTRIVADLIRHLGACERGKIGDAIEAYFANSSSDSQYWPDDNEIREGLRVLPVYRRLGRGRLRMVLEAIEDHRRGWHGGETGLGVRSRT